MKDNLAGYKILESQLLMNKALKVLLLAQLWYRMVQFWMTLSFFF